YWGRTLIVIPIIASIVMTLFFLLRLYSRRLTARKMDIDDIFMGLGLLFSYGVTICTAMAGYNGVSYDIWSLSPSTRQRATLLFWISQKLWPLSQVFVKLSIIILFRKLLGSVRHWRNITTALIALTIGWGIAAMAGNVLQCWPPQFFWRKEIDGSCMGGQEAFHIVIGSLSLVENFALVLMPVVAVWRLKLTPRQKVKLTVLFGVGGLACVVGILRLITFKDYMAMNLTSSGCPEAVWSIIELDLGIICASLILMRPLL
ncbi:hypothetical protein BO70DRAFT_260603, partial [Aspergillus heteromorphus CBS 117.55]